jgi:aldehyde dehydrogenase (NAD+)
MGGKSPCIVDETADIELSAKRIVWGKFLNAGQTCVAPDYLLVKREVKGILVKALVKQIKHFYGDDPIMSPDYCRIINQQNFDRLAAYLEEGHIISGGKKDRVLLSIEPTLIDELTWDSMLMQDEIFGPVLPVMEYDDLLDVISIINGGERPLALYFFSKNKKDQQRIIKEVSFGGGCINATVLQTANMYMPFGGVGNSGMGYYHGKWSFEAFSHKKSILNKSLLVDFSFLYPPYKDKVKLLKKFFK